MIKLVAQRSIQVGLALHTDPYLITLFFRPQELQLFRPGSTIDHDAPEPESETEDDDGSQLIWSQHQAWVIQLSAELSRNGHDFVSLLVTTLRGLALTPAVHPLNDYPHLMAHTDDQLTVAVHPLDRAIAYQGLEAALEQAGYQVIKLAHPLQAGPPS